MKKFFLFIVSLLFISCSSESDDSVSTNFCNEQVVDYYSNKGQSNRNIKNNAIVVEFDFNVSDQKITKVLFDLNLFKLPLNNDGVISTIYINFFSPNSTKMVVCYFNEGNLTCEKLSNYINQIQNLNDVLTVQKLYQGTTTYGVAKEGNYIKVKLNNENDLPNLEYFANQNGLVFTEYEPSWNETEFLVYYLIDNSGKKSVIELSKSLSESISYEFIHPQFISFQ